MHWLITQHPFLTALALFLLVQPWLKAKWGIVVPRWKNWYMWHKSGFWLSMLVVLLISLLALLITGLVLAEPCELSGYVDPNQERLCEQTSPNCEGNAKVRIDRIKELATRYPGHPKTIEALQRAAYSNSEGNEWVRGAADYYLNHQPQPNAKEGGNK